MFAQAVFLPVADNTTNQMIHVFMIDFDVTIL